MYLNLTQSDSEYNIVIGDMILPEIQDSLITSSNVFKSITDFGIETSYKLNNLVDAISSLLLIAFTKFSNFFKRSDLVCITFSKFLSPT